MEFQPITKHDTGLLREFHELALANHEPSKGPSPTWERLSQSFGEVRPGLVQRNWLAREDGRLVGHVALTLSTEDNPHLALGFVQVHRELRRRGIGRRLHDFLFERAVDEGRTTLMNGVDEPLEGLPSDVDPAGGAFLAAVGYKVVLTSVHSRLDLTTVPDGTFERLEEESWRHAADYEVECWVEGVGGGDCPEHVVEDLAYLEYRLTTDMPKGEMDYEPERPDGDRVRQRAASALASGQTFFNASARHKASGKTVAWTFIGMNRDSAEHAHQAITVVDPEHRGHRLGTLVKLANMRAAREVQPALRYVDTDNADDNKPMIAVNTAIGYQPTHASVTYQRKI